MIEAINQALDWELGHDADVVLLGEDIGTNGGVFRATSGLKEKYGLNRVLDTPLAETAIAGLTVGMAAQGMKPVAEIQFMGFIYIAMEQIVSHLARLRNRTRGRLSCPAVIRTPCSGGIHAPEHHSESTEAMFCHIPGFKVVVPSSPQRAYGLLLASIRDPDPVLFLEPTRLYRSISEPLLDNGEALPLGKCYTLRAGEDVSLISWGAMIPACLAAAQTMAEQGVRVEVIDVVTLSPLDTETLLASVSKTGRCVIVHEASLRFGPGAEIAALMAEKALFDLKAPVKRVAGFDCPIPYPRLEHYYIPDSKAIIAALTESLL
jgi:pyruvate dehydrogenase E1 component beta subunit